MRLCIRSAALGLAATACVTCGSAAAACAVATGAPHGAGWASVSVPGSACGSARPVRLHDWSATARSDRWAAAPLVVVTAGHRIVSGELVRGTPAAAVQVVCSNRGGTAAGQLAFAVVVYDTGTGTPRPIGVLTPRVASAAGVHVPLLAPVSIRSGRVTVEQLSYGAHDPDCCPSGRATTAWAYRAGAFLPAATVVARRPTR